MDTASNFILHSNHCNANFVKVLIRTAAAPRDSSLNAKFTFKERQKKIFIFDNLKSFPLVTLLEV